MNPSTPQSEALQAALARVRALANAGRWQEVLSCLRPFAAQAGEYPEIWRWQGLAWQRSGQPGRAVEALRMYAERHDTPQARVELAAALLDSGEPAAALELLNNLAADQRSAEAWFNLARAHKALGRPESALTPLENVVAEWPQHTGAWMMLGDARKALGDSAGAGDAYRAAIALDPRRGAPWWALSNLKAHGFSDEERESLARHARSAAGPEQPLFAFAEARALEDAGEYDQAFARYRAGNAAMRERKPWDRARYRQWLQRITAAQLALPVAELSRPRGTPRPVFIVSLPRSGSTLTEQVLAAHPEVTAASELPWVPRLVAAESRQRRAGLEEWAGAATAGDWQRLGAEFLQRTAQWHQTPVFTDKLPGNHAYIGVILKMLPDAQVVCVHREARDVCVSNFRQLFIAGNEFSYDLADLAAYWQDFEAVTAEWERVAPGRVHRLEYERLVSDVEPQVRALLAFLELDWDERCLRPQDAQRAVNTASAAQVREGIHGGGLGAWKRYEQHLGPLLEALKAE